MTEKHEYLNMKEATQYARISRPAVYAAMQKGKLKAKKVGHFWQFTKEDLDAYRLSKYNRDERCFNGEKIFSIEKGTFSITQAAKIMSHELNAPYNRHRLYYLIRRGQLKVSRFGCSFIIKRETLIDLIEKERGLVHVGIRA